MYHILNNVSTYTASSGCLRWKDGTIWPWNEISHVGAKYVESGAI